MSDRQKIMSDLEGESCKPSLTGSWMMYQPKTNRKGTKTNMISAWWLIPAVVLGACIGVFCIALVDAGK